jgi:3-hydroxyacyl-CoA dehydrogenase/enoyl-CoA hydratase/3-hydroxybutyryl-CoA epimerase
MGDGSKSFEIERRADGVAVVWMDVPGEPLNTLKASFADEFEATFGALEADDAVEAVVFASKKKGCFIAGADVAMIAAAKSEAEVTALAQGGQRAIDRLARFPKPVVAAIDGVALGGGLEVALGCHARVASSGKETKLGFPECLLGLLPGASGTQRLPRLIGVQPALDLMLTGKTIDAKKARRLGLVDDVVRPSILLEVAAAAALARVQTERGARATRPTEEKRLDLDALAELALTRNPLGRKLLFDQARKKLHAKTRGLYPAQDRILDVVKLGLEEGFEAGLEAEARAFGALARTPESEAMRGLFFATNALKKDSGVDDPAVEPRPVDEVGMVGAGLMGAGITYVTAAVAKTEVRLKDKDAEGLLGGLRYVRDLADGRVRRKAMRPAEADALMATITATLDYGGFKGADVVIEAVFEDLELKRRTLREVEAAGRDDVIFASNTSSLPIAALAEASAHPETVIGMHYFSPVPKMPLLEVVVTEQTAPWVTATCVALGKKQGKHVIVVNDGVGFYTTRVLSPMLNEAAHLVAEGVPIDVVDRALVGWGFPVGPLKLTDEVGIDVGAKIGAILFEAFGERMAPPRVMTKIIEDGRKGRKNGRGFYRYGGRTKGVDESVYDVLGVRPGGAEASAEEIALRCALALVNEAARCFGEGVLRSARDGDVGAVFGLGFPPFRGGPFRFVDRLGAGEVVRRLEALHATHGGRFAPAPALVRMAKDGTSFHGARPARPGEAPAPRDERAAGARL